MGFSVAESQAILDLRFPTTGAGDYIGFSVNGTSEWAGLARKAVGATGWAAATAADPSVKANAASLTSAAASLAGTVSHAAVFSASTGGTQRTDWIPATEAKAVTIGGTVTIGAGAFRMTLT